MPTTDVDPAPESLRWRVWPLRERPAIAPAVALVILGFGVVTAVVAGDWLVGALGALVLVIATSRYWLPSTLHADGAGLALAFPVGTRRIAWPAIRAIHLNDRAALLRITPSGWFGRFRGGEITLAFDDADRSHAFERVARAYVPAGTPLERRDLP